jgi:predicted permease
MVRVRSGLVVAEVALSMVLLTGAALLFRSFINLQSVDSGVAADEVWTLPLTPTALATAADYRLAMDQVEASLASAPGVMGATYGLSLPHQFTGGGRCCWGSSSLTAEGESLEQVRIALQPVTESYFQTLGIDLRAGRAWSSAEAVTDPWPVVLNEGLAVRLFGSAERAVGRAVEVGGEVSTMQVVGVAGDVRHYGVDQDPPLSIYLPMEKLEFTIPLAHMAVRVRGEAPAGLSRMLREAVWAVAPDLPVPTVRPMTEWLERSTASRRFESALFGIFGIVALILAAAGLYGTLLYNVGQRRREVGIRMELGAARRRVERQVVGQGLGLALAGCTLGTVGAWAAGRLLQSRLYDLQAADPGTLGSAVVVLLGAAAVASWLPARRAAQVDPAEVLREE